MPCRSRTTLFSIGIAGCFVFGVSCAHHPLPDVAPPAAPTATVRLPARLIDKVFFVQTTIDGHGPFEFCLDTGASWTVISSNVFDRLKESNALIDAPDGHVSSATGDRHEYDFVKIKNIGLGAFRATEAMAFVHDLAMFRIALGRDVDGIIGMELFRACQLVIDFPGGILEVRPSGSPPPEGSLSIPCRFDGYTPRIRLGVGAGPIDLTIDTGANATFSVPVGIGPHAFEKSPIPIGFVMSVTQIREEQAARLQEDLLFGGLRYEKPTVALAHTETGQIGTGILRRYAFGLDQANDRAWFLPEGDRSPISFPPIKNLGMIVLPEESVFRVKHVLPESDAAKAGIRDGDAIAAIDGLPPSEWKTALSRARMQEMESFEITWERKGEKQTLRLNAFTAVE